MARNYKIRVIGIGNRYRSDDSVGPRVIDELKAMPKTSANLDIIEFCGDGATLIELWDGFDKIVLVDASNSGANPGTIHRFDAISQEIPSTFFNYSTHAFSVAEAIEVARKIKRLPEQMQLFGIEGSDFGNGLELSSPVEQALPLVVAELTQLLSIA